MNPVEEALSELHAALAHFVDLLEQESNCLRDINAEALSTVVADKSRSAERVNTAWNRVVIACGVDTRQGGKLDTALEAFPELQGKWQEIKLLVSQAGQLNQGNSVLIDAQMRRTRQALDVLQSAADRGSLYGANGLMVDNLQHLHTLNKV